MRVLLLEDDIALGTGLVQSLRQAGYDVLWVRLTADARRLLVEDSIALALLDIGLSDGSGLDLLIWARRQGLRVPVMMLSARNGVADRVHGLDQGADDYLPKPFVVDELLSRMRALIRRSGGFATSNLTLGRITIDPERHQTSIDGKPLPLSRGEYALLTALASRRGRVLTRTQLQSALRLSDGSSGNSLDVIIHRLRRKLGEHLPICTMRGIGYVIEGPRGS